MIRIVAIPVIESSSYHLEDVQFSCPHCNETCVEVHREQASTDYGHSVQCFIRVVECVANHDHKFVLLNLGDLIYQPGMGEDSP
jgi:hypothetical protein